MNALCRRAFRRCGTGAGAAPEGSYLLLSFPSPSELLTDFRGAGSRLLATEKFGFASRTGDCPVRWRLAKAWKPDFASLPATTAALGVAAAATGISPSAEGFSSVRGPEKDAQSSVVEGRRHLRRCLCSRRSFGNSCQAWAAAAKPCPRTPSPDPRPSAAEFLRLRKGDAFGKSPRSDIAVSRRTPQ